MKNCLQSKKPLLTIAIISTLMLSPFAMAQTTTNDGFIRGSSLNTKFISDTRVRSNNVSPDCDFHSRHQRSNMCLKLGLCR